jgi:arylsulfatase A-like enzyme
MEQSEISVNVELDRAGAPLSETEPGARANAAPTKPRSVLWLCVWLAIGLIAAKAATPLSPAITPPPTAAERVRDVGVATANDLLYVTCIGLVAAALLRLTARWPRAQRIIWIAFAFLCTASLFYGIVTVPVFVYLGSPLTYPLLHVAGDLITMGSSIRHFLTPALLAVLIGAPLVYGVLVSVSNRYLVGRSTRGFRAARMIVIALLIALVVADVIWSRDVVNGRWGDRDDHRWADNPHWVLIDSCAQQLLGRENVSLAGDYPPGFRDEFKPFSQRPPVATTMPAVRPKNVILIVLESVGTLHLSLYGSPYDTMPRLKREADANGMVFDNIYSHVGMTANSLASILLSNYPPMTWRQVTADRPDLPGMTPAQALRERGMRTAFITSGDNRYVNTQAFLANRGFDVVWDQADLGCEYLFTWGVEDRCMIDGLIRWIDQDRAASTSPATSVLATSSPAPRPFFAMTWTQQTHHPYALKEDEPEIDFFKGNLPIDDYDLGRYLNALRQTDTQIGRLIDALRERGLADDTLIVITGDHGEAFGSPHDTYGHGPRLYEENLRVPLVLLNPKMFPTGRRSDVVGGLIDLAPTMLHALGLPPMPTWQGNSLFQRDRSPRAYFYAANDGFLFGVREGKWKYIYNATRGREELFDLSTDPREQRNVAAGNLELSRRLRQHLAAWVDDTQSRFAIAR